MSVHIGWPERLIRLAAGILILGLYGALPEPWRYLTLVGLLPLGTALTGHCPVGAALGKPRA
jgi:hypothetical protein